MIAAKFVDRGANALLIAFEKRFVEAYFFPFFFAGAFLTAAFALAVVVEALAMPSDSDRLSSTRTVCVIASVPLVSGLGFASAGAIVWVVASAPGRALCREHARAINIRRRMAFFTPDPLAEAMQFP